MNKLTPEEVTVIQMALQNTIEDLEAVGKDPTIPFTPEARKDAREILGNAKSALKKIQSTSGHAVRMDPYKEGDEKDFFTKES